MNQINEIHKAEFGALPEAVASAPARFHLIGERSWFFKDKTLSLALDYSVSIGASKRDDECYYYLSAEKHELKKTNIFPMKYKKDDRWANFIKSVIYGLNSLEIEVPGLNFTVSADIPNTSGFGLSTAIKVAAVNVINEVLDLDLSDSEMISAIEIGDREFLKDKFYLADIFTALYAKKNAFVLTDHAKESFEVLPFDFSGKSIIIIETRVPRFEGWNEEFLHEAEYALLMGDLKDEKSNAFGGWVYNENLADIHEILASCGEKNIRKLIGLIREHRCVLEAYEGLVSDQFGTFARAVNTSHENMRDYYEISCPEVDWILKRLLAINPNISDSRNPYSCGRICGKGDFRCIYAFVPDENLPELEKKLSEFERIFGVKAKYFKVSSGDGVKVVS